MSSNKTIQGAMFDLQVACQVFIETVYVDIRRKFNGLRAALEDRGMTNNKN